MTITYTAEVATCKKFGCFVKLLFRWRGSVYKYVCWDICLFLAIYYTLHFSYRFLMNDDVKNGFESIVMYCNDYVNLIPLSFVLGFFVSLIMTRWWEQYLAIPWPDTLAVFVSVHVHGLDERGRVMRRTVMRYACLCQAIVFTMIAPRVKQRFPTWDHLVEAGLMLDNEREILEDMSSAFPKHPLHWMPIVWAASIITRARKEGRIRDDLAVRSIIDELNKFRAQCGSLLFYDFINVPLVYTQVVTLAVYTYFLCCVVGQQWIESKTDKNDHHRITSYFPLFTIVQFLCYMGWLKVAEILINPWGDDDDDFEVNWMIDRNLQMSYLIVDEMHNDHPELVRDQYWDEVFPNELPYANEQLYTRSEPPEHSTNKMAISNTRSTITSTKQSVDYSEEKSSKVKTYLKDLWSRTNTRDLENDKNDNNNYDAKEAKMVIEKSDTELEEEFITVLPRRDSNKTRYPNVRKIFEITRSSKDKLYESEKAADVKVPVEEIIREEEDEKTLSDKEQNTDDEFEKLKLERERERLERNRKIYVRTVEALIAEPEYRRNSESEAEQVEVKPEQLTKHIPEPVPKLDETPDQPPQAVTFADYETFYDITSSVISTIVENEDIIKKEDTKPSVRNIAVQTTFEFSDVSDEQTDEKKEEEYEDSDSSIIIESDDHSFEHVTSSRSNEI